MRELCFGFSWRGLPGEVEKKQDKLILQVEKVDDKIDDQSEDLAAIKEKLKIR